MSPSKDADDSTLVAAVQGGDQAAFKILMQRYQRKIYAVAYGFLRNQEDALDVVQEAFIKVYRYLPKFEGNSSFYTWLYRIVANLCIDHLRKRKRHRDVEFDDGLRNEGRADVRDDVAKRLSEFGDPEELLRRREFREAYAECKELLTDKHRAVIVMREEQGMTYEEMAQAMACSKGTIMSRLFHARKNMQKHLTERIPELVPGGSGEQSAGSNKNESATSKRGEGKADDAAVTA